MGWMGGGVGGKIKFVYFELILGYSILYQESCSLYLMIYLEEWVFVFYIVQVILYIVF